jgi:hypothetical protein
MTIMQICAFGFVVAVAIGFAWLLYVVWKQGRNP